MGLATLGKVTKVTKVTKAEKAANGASSNLIGWNPAVTYGSYLHIDNLLKLQQPRSDGPEHDELLFIVIHQVYELWFKEVLHELDYATRLFEADDPYRAQHTLKRILTVLKVLVAQLDILETMTPLEFQSFRAAPRGGERISVGSVPSTRIHAWPQVAAGDRAVPAGQPCAGGAAAPLHRANALGWLSEIPLARGLPGARVAACHVT